MEAPAAFEVRPAADADASAIRALLLDAYGEFEDRLTPENWQKMRSGFSQAPQGLKGGELVVAASADLLVGFVAYFRPGASDPTLFEPHWASIRLLAVSTAARGLGIGRRLTRWCLDRARADGAAAVGLHTSEVMDRARGMYERAGFTRVRELPPRFGVRYWVYRLDLA